MVAPWLLHLGRKNLDAAMDHLKVAEPVEWWEDRGDQKTHWRIGRFGVPPLRHALGTKVLYRKVDWKLSGTI